MLRELGLSEYLDSKRLSIFGRYSFGQHYQHCTFPLIVTCTQYIHIYMYIVLGMGEVYEKCNTPLPFMRMFIA